MTPEQHAELIAELRALRKTIAAAAGSQVFDTYIALSQSVPLSAGLAISRARRVEAGELPAHQAAGADAP